jgi:threonine-phosphate decarboxylase
MSTPHHIPAPAHGGQLRQIAERFGVEAKQLIDFSANINPAGPPPPVLTALRYSLEDPATLTAYPDLEQVFLKQTIAEVVGVQLENITVANGFAPLLTAALQSLHIKRCLLPVPSFSEYRSALENAGCDVTPYRLSQDKAFRYEPDDLLRALIDHSCDAILLANPQNPSGAMCDAGEIWRLIEMAAERKIMVLLDEAFIDYCPDQSLTARSVGISHVIVFRSVTKFFAIPGLRVAYAVSEPSGIKTMGRFIAPWPITSFAADAVVAALRDEEYAEESRAANKRRRSWLEREFVRLKVATYPSNANFLLLRFPSEVDVNLLWERMILEQQIVLRSCANFEGLADGHLRIAVRSEPENERLIRGLEQVLSGYAG